MKSAVLITAAATALCFTGCEPVKKTGETDITSIVEAELLPVSSSEISTPPTAIDSEININSIPVESTGTAVPSVTPSAWSVVSSEAPASSKPASSKAATSSKTASKTETSSKAPAVSSEVSKAQASSSSKAQTAGSRRQDFEAEVIRLINIEREKVGVAPLSEYAPLTGIAYSHSLDMATNNFMAHESPTTGSPYDRMAAAGISYRAAAENVAAGQTTPAAVVTGWMNSSGHRANILNASYTKTGVGAVTGRQGCYWTQTFIG